MGKLYCIYIFLQPHFRQFLIRIFHTIYNMLMGLLESSEMSRMEWVKQWFDLIIGMFLEYYKDISELDEALQRSGKRIIFIVDGLEDVCADSQTEKNDRWKNLLKALCQNVVNLRRHPQDRPK